MTLPVPDPGPEKSGFDYFGYWTFIIEAGIWARFGYGESKVLPILMKRANSRTGQAFPTVALLCREAGLSKTTVQKAIKVLVGSGLVKKKLFRTRAGKRRVVYTLVWPLENDPTIKPTAWALLSRPTIKPSASALLRDPKGRFGPKPGAPPSHNKAYSTDKTIRPTASAINDLMTKERKKEEEGSTSAKMDINAKEVRKPDTAQPRPYSKALFEKILEAGGPGKAQALEALDAGRITLIDEPLKEEER